MDSMDVDGEEGGRAGHSAVKRTAAETVEAALMEMGE
jgi:hypothetical protein